MMRVVVFHCHGVVLVVVLGQYSSSSSSNLKSNSIYGLMAENLIPGTTAAI